MTIAGSLTSARAIATRCCWPPDSSLGMWRIRSPRPTSSSSSRPRTSASRRPRPAYSAASATFSSAESVGMRLKPWKMKPIDSRRTLHEVGAAQPVDAAAVQPHLAVIGRVEAAGDVHERRLARARRPHDRGHLAAADVERGAAQRVDEVVLAELVALAQADRVDDGREAVAGACVAVSMTSLIAQRLHRVEARRVPRRVEPADHAEADRERERADHQAGRHEEQRVAARRARGVAARRRPSARAAAHRCRRSAR